MPELSKDLTTRRDEYGGHYKSPEKSVSEDEKTGNKQNPVRADPEPWKNLTEPSGSGG